MYSHIAALIYSTIHLTASLGTDESCAAVGPARRREKHPTAGAAPPGGTGYHPRNSL